MEINKYIKTELAKLDRGIVATPGDRERLELFVKANNGIDYANTIAKTYSDRAKDSLKQFPDSPSKIAL